MPLPSCPSPRATKPLRQTSAEFLGHVLASAGTAYFVTDEKATVTHLSAAAATLLRVDPNEVVGKSAAQALHNENQLREYGGPQRTNRRQTPQAGLLRWLKGLSRAESIREKWLYRRGDGSQVNVAATVSKIPDNLSPSPALLWVLIDRTAEVALENLHRASERRYRSVFDSAPTGMAVVSPDGNWLDANPALCRLVGCERAELLDQSFQSLTHPDDVDESQKMLEEALAGKRTGYALQKRYIRKDGTTVWVQLVTSLIRLPSGAPLFFISQVLDVTDRVATEARLRQARDEAETANRAKSGFLAIVSHEIRTPLNAIIGYSHLLEETPLQDEQREYLESIRAGGNILLTVINDILDFSKIEAGKIVLDMEPFDLHACLQSALAIVRVAADEKGLKLHFEISDNLSRIFLGDETRLTQVLINLLTNAVKFTQSGFIKLVVSKGADRQGREKVFFAVEDTGVGIPQDQLPDLFQPFSQVKTAGTRSMGGTGLGLVICQRLVALMGGVIRLRSRVGYGTRVAFSLPAKTARATAKEKPRRTNGNARPRSMPPDVEAARFASSRILVAEDNVTNQKLVKRILKNIGIEQVDFAADGKQAVELYKQNEYSVILMDCQMPVLDGFAATRAIRGVERESLAQRIPIIALTAAILDEDKQDAVASGMDDFLAKPFDPQTLREMLASVLADNSS